MKRVLFIRLDKIGDLICTLPSDQVLNPELYDVTWVVQKGLGEVVELGAKKRRYLELDKKNKTEAQKQLREFLKQNRFDFAISFQCPWWVNYELFRARIRIRSGVFSQWHSFLFLNYGLRQKRSQAIKHELDYNLDLVYETFKIKQSKEYIYYQIEKPAQTDVIEKHHLKAGCYTVVHPGMMGSAENWTQIQYIKKINQLLSEGLQVAVTGTDADTPYLTEIKKEFEQNPNVVWLQSKLNLKELVQVLAHSRMVIAPSTGVAHIAASVGAAVKGIYSDIRVQSPTRWAPRGADVEIWKINSI